MRGDLRPIGQHGDAIRIAPADFHDILRRDDLGAETPSLDRRSPRQVGTAHAVRKAEIVLNPRAGAGLPAKCVPFDEKTATIPNTAGRVVYQTGGDVVPGEYVVGWAKRGPTGVIGTNKPDSAATVASMLEDLADLAPIADRDRDPVLIEQLLERRECDYVTYEDWSMLDQAETERGAEHGRPRVKFIRVPEMLSVIRGRGGAGRRGAAAD